MDPLKVDDVLEVPAYKDVDGSNRSQSDMLSIHKHALRHDLLPNVLVRECAGLIVLRHVLHELSRYTVEDRLNLIRAASNSAIVLSETTMMASPLLNLLNSRCDASRNASSRQPPITEVST